jgi:hypothetical protein
MPKSVAMGNGQKLLGHPFLLLSMVKYAVTRDFSKLTLWNNINGGRNSKIGAGKMLKFDATMKCPGKIQCYLGCEGIGNCPRSSFMYSGM